MTRSAVCRAQIFRAALCGAVLTAGCMGQIGEDVAAGGSGSPGGGGVGGFDDPGSAGGGVSGPGGVGGSSPITPGVAGKVCGTYPGAKSGPGQAPLRRLTRVEYNNTVADLLGDTSNPADGFPQDAKKFGFNNSVEGQIVTASLAAEYFEAAEGMAARASLGTLAPCNAAQSGEDVCARTFITAFGQRAFRRPLSDGDTAELMDIYTAAREFGDHQSRLKAVLTGILASPYFIYRPEFGDPTGAPDTAKGVVRLSSWEMASRLSYLLWSTMPDAALFAAAEKNELQTTEQVAAQARRMLADKKARATVAAFHQQWLELDRMDKATKTGAAAAAFDKVKGFMSEETARFLESAFWTGDGSVKNLFTSSSTYMNSELAAYLGMPAAQVPKAGAGFKLIEMDANRLGLLTQASELAIHSKDQTSPTVRGKFVLEQVMCMEVPPPPPEVMAVIPAPKPGQTTRERFAQHGEAGCASCHRLMDPTGFAFENFDALGKWRITDAGKPVDATGGLTAGTDIDGPVANAVELSRKVADSADMKKCVAKQWFRFAMGRQEVQSDEKSLEQMFCAFEGANFNMRDLLVGLASSESFMYKPASNGGAP